MVKWIVIASIAVAVLLAGATAYWLLKKSDLDIVKSQVRELAEKCAKTGDESPITAMGSANALANLFADGCGFELDKPALGGIYKKEEIASHALLLRNYFKSAAFSIHDLEASMTTKLTAKAQFTIYVSGTLQGGDKIREARDIEAMLVKSNGQWVFSEMKAANPIRK